MSDPSKPARGGKRPNAGRKPSGRESIVIRVDKQLLPEIEKLKAKLFSTRKGTYKKKTNELDCLRIENIALKSQLDTYSLNLDILKQELEELTQKLTS